MPCNIEEAKQRILNKLGWENNEASEPVILWGPPGVGKCITGDSLVFTNKGLLTMEELKPNKNKIPGNQEIFETNVLGLDKIARSSHFHYDGKQKTIKIISSYGYKISGTDKHRVIVAGENGPVWKRLDQIKPGDYVGIIRRQDLPEGQYLKTNTEYAYLLGYYVGDGSSFRQKNKSISGLRWTVGKQDIEHFKKYIDNISLFFGKTGYVGIYPDKRNGVYTVGVFNSVIAKRIVELCGDGADNKKVPLDIRMSSKQVWLAFLQGLFDSDGTCSKNTIELASNSEILISTVQIMLTAFGIVSAKKQKKKSFRLIITGEDARLFIKNIGFRLERKQSKLDTFNKKCNVNKDIVPVSKTMWHNLKSCGVLPKSIHKMMDHYLRGQNPSRVKFINILQAVFGHLKIDAMDCFPEWKKLYSQLYFWDKISKVESYGEHNVYDLVVPGEKSFAANGMMNHNTELVVSIVCDRMLRELEEAFITRGQELKKMGIGVESNIFKDLVIKYEEDRKVLDFDYVSHDLLELISPHLLVIRLAERPIEQLQGVVVPSLSQDYARFVMPENLARLKQSPWGIVFLDELDKASDSKFGAATHILENNIIGDFHLPKGWITLAACNREEDSHLSNPVPPELRNRAANIEIDQSLNSWIKWAINKKVRPDLILFHRFTHGEWLAKYDLEQSYAFPTPRTWAKASRAIQRLEAKIKPQSNDEKEKFFDKSVRVELEDFVGREAATAYYTYRKLYLSYPVDQILNGTKKIPTEKGSTDFNSIISEQCTAAFAVVDQITAEHLKPKDSTKETQNFLMGNFVNFIKDLTPEIRTIFLQSIHKTRIMHFLLDCGQADDLIEQIVEYIASA